VLFIDEVSGEIYHIASKTRGQWLKPGPVVKGINAQ
jgi:hypothetical protein